MRVSDPPDDDLICRCLARVGQVVKDKWHLDKLLGVGGMAAVYEATHRNASRAAVKMLHVELSLNKAVRTRFLREGYVANTVGHPGAVRILDDDMAEDGSVFLVMELLEGETLTARINRLRRPLPVDEVLGIAEELLDVLEAAHGQGIIHRDIKPDNVLVTPTGAVKVLDFGIARVMELVSGPSATCATKAGSTLGTPAFMPPEQALGRAGDVDARSDVWAVGATMFTMLSGRLVHLGETPNEQLVSAATLPAPSLLSVMPAATPSLVEIVDRALKFEKAERWPTAAAMQEAVRKARRDLASQAAKAAAILPAAGNEPGPAISETKSEDIEITLVRGAMKPKVQLEPTLPEPKLQTLAGAGAMTRSGPAAAAPARRGRLLAGGAAGVAVLSAGAFLLLRDCASTRTTTTGSETMSALPTISSALSPSQPAAVDAGEAEKGVAQPAGSSPAEASSGAHPEQPPPAKRTTVPAKGPTKKANDWLGRRH